LFKETQRAGWGRVISGKSSAARPEQITDLRNFFSDSRVKSVCAYGAGRSYGDCAINEGGTMLLTERLDRILSFNEESGTIVVEPGVTFRKLLEVFLPRGWLVPVTPGTGFATIGGAVANDVHGKNHEHAGSFGQHVTEIDLLTPDGVLHTIGPHVRPHWFNATVGGIGLTGIITRIAFRLMRVPGPMVEVTERRMANLDALLAAFAENCTAAYSVAWIDALARGPALGRGILETAEPKDAGSVRALRNGPSVPLDFPNFALNPLSIAMFNAAYLRRVPTAGRVRLRGYDDFLYPLDAIGNWNRIYGRRGFHQFQCVIPDRYAGNALPLILETIASARKASFLVALKRLGAGRAGYLSFPMEGYTLALDFPNTKGIDALYAKLVEIVLEHQGRIYLAKDALLAPEAFARMYPELPAFLEALAEIDPQKRMSSNMARRLGLRQAA
jgi:decaprenylphospho-beta-D-ribofuranose 2-oxidase